jgi:ribonuclease T1
MHSLIRKRRRERSWGALWLLLLAWLASYSGTAAARGPDALEPSAGTIAIAHLPPEAQETLRRIEVGAPSTYIGDGRIFENREGRLPRRPRGYYREYTVPTPGARDRGARRIVAGREGERYYTDDHYRTFKRVLQ